MYIHSNPELSPSDLTKTQNRIHHAIQSIRKAIFKAREEAGQQTLALIALFFILLYQMASACRLCLLVALAIFNLNRLGRFG
jgi:hypothetical protein